ncbi:MAG: hypothetical protein AAGH15_10275 [Myxococcota bacterium]
MTLRTLSLVSLLLALGAGCGGDDLPLGGEDAYEPVTFTVAGTDAHMRGVLDARALPALNALADAHPEVTRIVMDYVPGSANDEASQHAHRRVRALGLATHVPANGFIASGGVDFFVAGARRTIEEGAVLGVHSWSNGSREGGDLPRDHPGHRLFLELYADLDVEEAFYWFTLEAAPAAGLHAMSVDELNRFGLLDAPPLAPPAEPGCVALCNAGQRPTTGACLFGVDAFTELDCRQACAELRLERHAVCILAAPCADAPACVPRE